MNSTNSEPTYSRVSTGADRKVKHVAPYSWPRNRHDTKRGIYLQASHNRDS